jgi:hypothetical protein
MANADQPVERLARQPDLQVLELALGAPTAEPAMLERGDPGRVIAAVFEPPQRLDHLPSDSFLAENAYDSAHAYASREVFVAVRNNAPGAECPITMNVEL